MEYINFMRTYQDLGHMEKIPLNEIHITDNTHFYLPHHAVIKESSSTTQTRVVFDGSFKSSNGTSLNDNLMVGPTIQSELWTILSRFRVHSFVFTADIEKMYRQIKIDSRDKDFQRILWRESTDQPVQHYRLTTVTYGTASAPFLATRALHQLSIDEESRFPLASPVVRRDFYVDDLLTGANTLCDAVSLKNEIVHMLNSAGFHLRKWSSNHPQLLQTEQNNNPERLVSFDDGSISVKILGIQWEPTTDSFSFKVSPNPDLPVTKRNILSESSRIFDPFGWLAPSTILLKILFQSLWIQGVDWDEQLSVIIKDKWTKIRNEFPKFEEIKIPRQISANSFVEYHGFCDASDLAYAAVVYCRSINSDGSVKVAIIASKTKVTPIKQVSIPRLELCGAHLLAKLITKVVSSLFYESKIFAWTDSSVVLSWLSDHPKKWTTFVANRTSEILSLVPRASWNHVKSDDNPADCATRGVLPSELINHHQWWSGPHWLSQDVSYWPVKSSGAPTLHDENEISIELKPNPIRIFYANTEDSVIGQLVSRISSWPRLLRTLSFCLRFITKSSDRPTGGLSVSELNKSTELVVKWAQQEQFSDVISLLVKKQPLNTKCSLLALSPFIDAHGVLRVGGRLEEAEIGYNTKHPMIL